MDIKVNGKDVPVVKAKAGTTLLNLKTGVKYKNEEEWKALGIDPKQIRRNVKITVPSLDLFAKTKQIEHSAKLWQYFGQIMAIIQLIYGHNLAKLWP